ncbi:hypothetical protein SDC9_92291 [bioreactor metagenome]|uniref:Uncharacterized protein n=1 Tax=bioreactor metagenome TaxID=1076179 RepID=A0A645A418_9ZZZZ
MHILSPELRNQLPKVVEAADQILIIELPVFPVARTLVIVSPTVKMEDIGHPVELPADGVQIKFHIDFFGRRINQGRKARDVFIRRRRGRGMNQKGIDEPFLVLRIDRFVPSGQPVAVMFDTAPPAAAVDGDAARTKLQFHAFFQSEIINPVRNIGHHALLVLAGGVQGRHLGRIVGHEQQSAAGGGIEQVEKLHREAAVVGLAAKPVFTGQHIAVLREKKSVRNRRSQLHGSEKRKADLHSGHIAGLRRIEQGDPGGKLNPGCTVSGNCQIEFERQILQPGPCEGNGSAIDRKLRDLSIATAEHRFPGLDQQAAIRSEFHIFSGQFVEQTRNRKAAAEIQRHFVITVFQNDPLTVTADPAGRSRCFRFRRNRVRSQVRYRLRIVALLRPAERDRGQSEVDARNLVDELHFDQTFAFIQRHHVSAEESGKLEAF